MSPAAPRGPWSGGAVPTRGSRTWGLLVPGGPRPPTPRPRGCAGPWPLVPDVRGGGGRRIQGSDPGVGDLFQEEKKKFCVAKNLRCVAPCHAALRTADHVQWPKDYTFKDYTFNAQGQGEVKVGERR